MNINSPSPAYISRASAWLTITTLVYFLMNGAQLFETAVIVPAWAAHPPESLNMFRGPNGLDFKVFWIAFHLIHELTFIAAIIACWRFDDVRNRMLILFAGHSAVRVWTLMYFAPNIIEFQELANSNLATADLPQRTMEWMNYNLLRVALFILVSIGLLPLWHKVVRLKHSLHLMKPTPGH